MHQCKKLFWLEGTEDPPTNNLDTDPVTENPEISIHAISGSHNIQTIQVMGEISHTSLLILIELGSIHCFLDSSVAAQLGLQLQPCYTLGVRIANGLKLQCAGVWPGTLIHLGELTFSADLFLLKMDGFRRLIVLHEGSHSACNFSTSLLLDDQQLQLQSLLNQFTPIFKEPSGLPPVRHICHKILLEHGTNPIVVSPYRYPTPRKTKLNASVLKCSPRVIRHSTSPYSSLVLLVKNWTILGVSVLIIAL